MNEDREYFRKAVKGGLQQIPRDGLRRLQHELRTHPERVLLDGYVCCNAKY